MKKSANEKRKQITHQWNGERITTVCENSVFVYNSSSISGINKNKFYYMTSFVQQLQYLMDNGCDTLYFVVHSYDSLILSMIEQAVFQAKKQNYPLNLIGYSFEEVPDFIHEHCLIYPMEYKGYSKILLERILSYTSCVLGLLRSNDRLVKKAEGEGMTIYDIRPCELTSILKAELRGSTALNQSTKNEINEIIERYSKEGQKDLRCSFSVNNKVKFSVEVPYTYHVNTILNDEFYYWSECFKELECLIGFGFWRYYLGFNKLIYDGNNEWKIGKAIYPSELD